MNIKDYYLSKGIPENLLIKLILNDKELNEKELNENKDRILPYNNRAINGYCVKKDITTVISITKPKNWPEKGFVETNK